MAIKSIKARKIPDSRGNPTIEVFVRTDKGVFNAKVPSGASKGRYEALAIDASKAIKNVGKISKLIIGMDEREQEKIDRKMIKLDGTSNKRRLGANAILGVSMAVCRAGAAANGIPLYRHISRLAGTKMKMPAGFFNIINGGRHAKNKLDIQEYMIAVKEKTFRQTMKTAKNVYDKLGKLIKKQYGKYDIGDEGGYAPHKMAAPEEPINLILKAAKETGCYGRIKIALDCAASEFYKKGRYKFGNKLISAEKLADFYKKLIRKYPVISIEDPFGQDDFSSWKRFNSSAGIQVVGDDLLVTNVNRIKMAVKKRLCNALLLKVNQIGTVTESISAFKLAKKAGWNVMVSHRSGETTDSFIADLAVGLGCRQIKAGAPARAERMAKYNRLLEIEKEI